MGRVRISVPRFLKWNSMTPMSDHSVENQDMSLNFGAAYYPEHVTRERVEEDAKLMREAGMTLVRMAEFSWIRMEKEEGVYDFSWLDHAVETLAAQGDALSALHTDGHAPEMGDGQISRRPPVPRRRTSAGVRRSPSLLHEQSQLPETEYPDRRNNWKPLLRHPNVRMLFHPPSAPSS